MAFGKRLLPDILTLIKTKTGEHVERIRAQVSDSMVITQRADFDLDPGDIFVRVRSTGTKEQYRVLSPGYQPAFYRIQAHYQAKTEFIGALKQESANQAGNILVSGDNSHININSVDCSTNIIVNSDTNSELFNNLSEIAEKITDEFARSKVIDSITAMSQVAADKNVFAVKYNEFIACIANHMTLFLPYIPALTKLLTG